MRTTMKQIPPFTGTLRQFMRQAAAAEQYVHQRQREIVDAALAKGKQVTIIDDEIIITDPS